MAMLFICVSIAHGIKKANIIIKTLNLSITLVTPIQADVSWNYRFESIIAEIYVQSSRIFKVQRIAGQIELIENQFVESYY
jgi:hypothetical protein